MGGGHLEIKEPDEQLFPVKLLVRQQLEVPGHGLVLIREWPAFPGCCFQAILAYVTDIGRPGIHARRR